jgi:FAD/FMN-containing dehydrogenase
VLHFVERDNIVSWGRVIRERQFVARPRFRDELLAHVGSVVPANRLAIGLRRSYGDTCLNGDGTLIEMMDVNRFISFDANSGVLRAEAGACLSEVLKLIVPTGWFLPTTPGTRFVTLGGAVANDVHGKNHHLSGSIGRHIRSLGILRSDRGSLTVSARNDAALFAATVAGLGLTGIIEWVELQLVKINSAYLDVEIVPYGGLNEFWELANDSVGRFEHTVAWVDCTSSGSNLGRGILSRANWAVDGVYEIHSDKTWKGVPFAVPQGLLSRVSVGAFNRAYYRLSRFKASRTRQHYAAFFYPLDTVRNWNRLYGQRGMLQYQCVIPPRNERGAVRELFDVITASGQASFLAVLKTFGALASPGVLSFPREGTTLALDFPNRGRITMDLMAKLDAIVCEAGGALYPAKDGRMTGEMFQRSFPQWQRFAKEKDPAMNSNFWRRLAL